MSLFTYEKKDIIKIMCNNEEINGLSATSKLEILKAMIPSYRLPLEKINDNENYTCLMFIGDECYDFNCHFKKINDLEGIIDTYTLNKNNFNLELDTLVEMEAKSSNEEIVKESVNDITIENNESCSPSTMEFYLAFEKDYDKILNTDNRIFEIHSYDDFKSNSNKKFPFICKQDQKYSISFQNGKYSFCKNYFIAKLIAFYYENQEMMNLLRENDMLDYQFIDEYIRLVNLKSNDKEIKVLHHMNAKKVLDKIEQSTSKV